MSKRKSLDADLPSVPNVYKSPRRARGRGSLSRSLSEPNVGVHTTTLHLDIPSDTQIGMQVLKSQFPVDGVKSFAPIILKNQLYAIVHDHTEVDREVDLLRREGTIKVFKLLTGKNEYAILYSEDYLSLIEEAKKGATCKDEKNRIVFDDFIARVLPESLTDDYITKRRLEELLFADAPVDEGQITLLVNAGLLIRGREEEEGYWFAVPNAGFFLKACTKGRQEVVGLLKRQKHKELLQEEIENKRLRTSFLGPMFHVKDLIGQGILESVPTTAGPLIRIVK